MPSPIGAVRWMAVALGLCMASARLHAQTGTIVGTVLAREAGQTLAYGVVSVPSLGIERFTTVNGAFELRDVRAGRQRLVVRRLGYVPAEITVEVRAGTSDTVRIELSRVAVRLSAVQVRAYPECKAPGAPGSDGDAALAAVYTQLLINAEQYRVLAQSYPFAYVVVATRGHEDGAGTRSVVDSELIRIDGLPTWKYRPGRIITRSVGRRTRGELIVNIPTLLDFADPAFIANHCFYNGGVAAVDSSAQFRIDFVAASRIRSSDYAGSIYLDTLTYQIRRTVLNVLPPPAVRGITGMELETEFAEVLPSIPVIRTVYSRQTFNTTLRGVAFPMTFEDQHLMHFVFLGARPGDAHQEPPPPSLIRQR